MHYSTVIKTSAAIAFSLIAIPAFSAVDTATKRASVVNMTGMVLPVPDGTIGDGDRAHLLKVYGGLQAAEPADAGDGLILLRLLRRLRGI